MNTRKKLKFIGYYKYVFTFKGEKDGFTMVGHIGGDKDDIYRLTVKPEMFASAMDSIVITDKDENIVHERKDAW